MSEDNQSINHPRVLQVLPELNHGGVEVGTIEVASKLVEQGWKNFVASSGGRMVHDLKKLGVKHFELPLKTKNIFKLYKNSLALEKIIKENKIDIVHARSRAPAWSAYWAAKRAGVKYLTTFHGTYGLGPWGIKRFYNKVMTFGELVIAVSHHIKNHMLENYIVNKDKIRVIHRCVNIEKFSPEKVSQERMIKTINEYRLPEDKPIILLAGRLTRWKGQGVLVDALSKLNHKNYRCLLVGSDQGRTYYTDELKKKVKEYGLEDCVQFIGHNFDMPSLIMISDIVVSASTDPEAFGRAAVEGQAMGKIVLASNHGGSLENIVDGKTGRLFENNNSEALAEALNWALNLSNIEREEISKAAIKNVIDNFTKDKMTSEVLKVYEELVKLEVK